MSEWISCSEVPPKGTRVIVGVPDFVWGSGTSTGTGFILDRVPTGDNGDGINLHWMPLPEPPSGTTPSKVTRIEALNDYPEEVFWDGYNKSTDGGWLVVVTDPDKYTHSRPMVVKYIRSDKVESQY